MPVVAVSGGFDPIHVGHVRYIQEAAHHGEVHIYLNTDSWLQRKKGYVFMPFKDRAEILWSIKGVTLVVPADDDDDTVCASLQRWKPDFFAKGGDRKEDNTPELSLCNELGITVLFNMGGEKIESSSEIVKRAKKVADIPLECDWGK